MFSFIRCTACGSSAFSQTRGLIVVFGWTNLRLRRGEPTGICRACAARTADGSPLVQPPTETTAFDRQTGQEPPEAGVLALRPWRWSMYPRRRT
jgi:hypothetical protein